MTRDCCILPYRILTGLVELLDVYISAVSYTHLDVYKRQILVYDLQVEDDHEFYANGILVHNCSICGPNHLVVVPKAQRTWPNGATIPAHPNCRCRAIEETALTLETPLPREERYRWSAETYANYQAEQAAARRPTNIIDVLTG